ncbi:MAG: diguanylate cyclase [Bdellovibrionales bacterium]|nr:diguanylate cyclase [Bdellovibrionales bacterium]
MNIREISSQFSILVYTKNLNRGSSIKVLLSRAGYEVFYLENENNLFQTINESKPHVLIIDLESISTLLSELVEKINNISSEMKMIFLSSDDQFQVLTEYSAYNLSDIISNQTANIENKVLWSVDKCCENIFLTYKNEQIFSELMDAKSKQENASTELSKKTEIDSFKRVHDLIKDLRLAESKDDVIRTVFQNLNPIACLYFKYISSLNSFVLTNASPISEVNTEGVGCALPPEEAKDLVRQLTLSIIPVTLNNLIDKMFKFQKIGSHLVFDKNTFEGVFIYELDTEESKQSYLRDCLEVAALYYSYYSLGKRIDILETQDQLTEAFNRKFYEKKIEEEFVRAKRVLQPLSIIKISIDDFEEIEKSLGVQSRDQLFKSIAAVVMKTGRANDLTCKTADNEFSIIMPHCDKKGATLRAERLRRLIESQTMAESGLKITASLGVSEYPSLANSFEDLNQTAEKAKNFIATKGGNRICLYKAPSGFKPDFQIEEA